MPKAIWIKLISRYHNDLLTGHFGINKIQELITEKYFWPPLWYNVEAYIKNCDICLVLKAVKYKFYNNFQFLPVSIHWWKNLLMDFMTGLPVLTNWNGDSYDFILVIVDRLTKMVHYKLIKITINMPTLAKVIIDVVIGHHSLPNLIVTNRGFLFTSEFWSLLYYFFGIKRRLCTTFHP